MDRYYIKYNGEYYTDFNYKNKAMTEMVETLLNIGAIYCVCEIENLIKGDFGKRVYIFKKKHTENNKIYKL